MSGGAARVVEAAGARRNVAETLSTVESLVRSNVRLAAAVAALVVLAAVAAYLFARLRRSPGERFRRTLDDRDAVAVLTHPNPDPDAMAAAVGVATLADQLGTDATIQYSGQIRHQENRAFRTVLDLDLERITDAADLAASDVVLVDHNEARGFDGAGGVRPCAVVDHHPGDGDGRLFTDVRTDYGACASIVTEYFEDVGGRPVPSDRHASEVGGRYTLPTRVATGLLYGILSDTGHLTTGACEADFRAAAYLRRGVDDDLLDRVANPAVDAEVLDVKARAIAGREVRGSFAVSDVGSVDNADAIPQAADELLQLEGVTAVVVAGERNGEIHLSGRSRDDRVHMGRTLQTVVSDLGAASAGGHARMGGGRIPAEPGLTDGGRDRELEFTRGQLADRLFRAMSGDM